MPASSSAARHLVEAALVTWKLISLSDEAASVVGELVANAVTHATRGEAIRVRVTRHRARVRIAVIDKDPSRPAARPTDPADESGRGFAIVAALADQWGVDPLPWGKRVWADLEATQ
ncbi:ATP-binding protein [Streptomyces sp. NPDC050315]|uniref:ATP-binding protein n=1 Tax=Streptomyces sp. NPDC050315 TaxID=3155039 RepID=UPI003421D6A0